MLHEWREKKGSSLFVYRTLSAFMKEHFDGVALSFDKEKEAFIDDLMYAGNFATTHGIIAKLERYGYFSLKEVKRILEAAKQNNQVGMITTDRDLADFITRVAAPRRDEIAEQEYIEILDKVAEVQAERAKKNGVIVIVKIVQSLWLRYTFLQLSLCVLKAGNSVQRSAVSHRLV